MTNAKAFRVLVTLFGITAAVMALSWNLKAEPKELWDITGGVDSINTSDWETYVNRAYGYSFRYPENWQIFEPDPTDRDYLKRKWVHVVSPKNPRFHEEFGLTEYSIRI